VIDVEKNDALVGAGIAMMIILLIVVADCIDGVGWCPW